jgi:hypothetical protein
MLLVATMTTSAQSLFVLQGERAAEGSVGWSVGPFSNGLEVQGAASLDGRWDVGFGVNRYRVDFGGDADVTLTEWSPFVRYFLFKEADDGVPVSFAAFGQFVKDTFEGSDEGWYALAGGQLYKRLTMDESLALLPYVGFSLAGESFGLNGTPPDRSVYLTRQFGVHALLSAGSEGWVRVTVEEQSFRRETYRAVRATYIRRF